MTPARSLVSVLSAAGLMGCSALHLTTPDGTSLWALSYINSSIDLCVERPQGPPWRLPDQRCVHIQAGGLDANFVSTLSVIGGAAATIIPLVLL